METPKSEFDDIVSNSDIDQIDQARRAFLDLLIPAIEQFRWTMQHATSESLRFKAAQLVVDFHLNPTNKDPEAAWSDLMTRITSDTNLNA